MQRHKFAEIDDTVNQESEIDRYFCVPGVVEISIIRA